MEKVSSCQIRISAKHFLMLNILEMCRKLEMLSAIWSGKQQNSELIQE